MLTFVKPVKRHLNHPAACCVGVFHFRVIVFLCSLFLVDLADASQPIIWQDTLSDISLRRHPSQNRGVLFWDISSQFCHEIRRLPQRSVNFELVLGVRADLI